MKGHEETYVRETKGLNISGLVTPVFERKHIDHMLKAPPATIEYTPFIFVTVDPAAGGENSKYAIVSSVYRGDKMVVSLD
jgi:hypothetical protein